MWVGNLVALAEGQREVRVCLLKVVKGAHSAYPCDHILAIFILRRWDQIEIQFRVMFTVKYNWNAPYD